MEAEEGREVGGFWEDLSEEPLRLAEDGCGVGLSGIKDDVLSSGPSTFMHGAGQGQVWGLPCKNTYWRSRKAE